MISSLELAVLNPTKLNQIESSPRVLRLAGQVNQLPFALSTQLYNLAPFILDSQALTLDLTGSIDVVNFSAKGLLGENDNKTDLQLNINTPSLEILGLLVDQDIPNFGRLSASTHIKEVNGTYSLNRTTVSVKGKPAELEITGSATVFDQGLGANLQLSFSTPDISSLTNTDALENFSHWTGSLVSQIDFNNDVATLSNSQILLADQSQSIKSKIDQLAISLNDFSSAEISIMRADTQYQLVDATKKKPWRYQYKASSINASIDENMDIQVETTGRYKGVNIAATALWKSQGEFKINLGLDQLQAVIDGKIRENETLVVTKVQLPNLDPLASILGTNVIPIAASKVNFNLLIKNQELYFSDVDIALAFANSKINLSTIAKQPITFNEFSIETLFESDSLGALEAWLQTHSASVDQTISAVSKRFSSASNATARPPQDLAPEERYLHNILKTGDFKNRLRQYPALDAQTKLAFTVAGSHDNFQISASDIHLQSDLAEVKWAGQYRYRPDFFEVQGELSLTLETDAVANLTSAVSVKTGVSFSSDSALSLNAIQVIAGKSIAKADLTLHIDDGLQHVEGQINFSFLDIVPFFPNETSSHKQTEAASETRESSLLFSTDQLPIALKLDTTANLEITAQAIKTPWLDTERAQTKLLYVDSTLSLEVREIAIGDSTITGLLALDNSHETPALSIVLQAERLDPDRISVLRNYDVVRSGSLDALLNIQTQGNSEQDLVENMNGKVTLVTRNAFLNGDDLAQIAPEILTQLNRRLNPFYKKGVTRDTELQCAVIHFDIDNGLLLADKSIVLVTPDMVVGAHGVIDLAKNKMRMQVAPRARKGLGISLVGSAAKLALIAGNVNQPRLQIDSKGALTSVGLNVAGTALYGPLYWIYQGQVQKLLTSAKTCETTIAKVAPRFTNAR